ncbi:extracellular solute-binding protein [Pseudorhodoferax sp. Leaf265]|uniref:extracellular solute-binding protein n=1 Tax=Pseudorhodoferax sp. Leaf265 TaxID=1736315 RepID=UPI0006F350ED|nr:extracellular solute-binding protein [Pseudorhodoferax sp. Leaf265]KQP06379.1 oligopeptide ABC transporter periplasmic substrate-binding protein [Pseudorhodoferax sp. Leaf265]
MRYRVLPMLAVLSTAALLALPVGAASALGMGYTPKYAATFSHFDYVNPNAPKGGELVLSAAGGFDKLNPFTLRGTPPAGMGFSNGFVFAEYGLLFDSLTTPSEDEPFSTYGLLAEDIALAPDGLSVVFRLHPKARFSDGTPVLAADVKYSFDTLTGPQASPTFRAYWSGVKQAVVTGERSIRFDFKQRNAELHMILGQMPVFSRAWGQGKPLDKIVTEAPLASGPYVVERAEFGRSISYRRRADYWAAELPVRRGMFNFDRVRYEYFKDRLGEEESLKVGALDALEEGSISAWLRRYQGARFASGELVKEEIAHRRSTGMQALVFNLRQARFADLRVRQAFALAFDFDWMNQRLFYGRRVRTQSYFQNSDDLMAGPAMTAQEEALLQQLRLRTRYADMTRGELPRPAATGSTADALRRQLLQARGLLNEAGWHYRDGALRNAASEPFVVELDIASRASEAVLAGYVRNLATLGIELRLRLRDASLIKARQDAFEFDMAVDLLAGSSSPGNELIDDLGSVAAAQKGSRNLAGISDPVIDELIEHIVASHDRTTLAAGARLLDRFLLHQHYGVPMYYDSRYYVARKAWLQHPEVALPQRLLARSWLLTMWWAKQP